MGVQSECQVGWCGLVRICGRDAQKLPGRSWCGGAQFCALGTVIGSEPLDKASDSHDGYALLLDLLRRADFFLLRGDEAALFAAPIAGLGLADRFSFLTAHGHFSCDIFSRFLQAVQGALDL
jgi:hypothetical protein